MGFGNVRLNGAMAISKWRVAGTLCKAIQAATISACRLFRNIEQVQKLSELGVLFLLFEMGLELSLDRLKVNSPFHDDTPMSFSSRIRCDACLCQCSGCLHDFPAFEGIQRCDGGTQNGISAAWSVPKLNSWWSLLLFWCKGSPLMLHATHLER